MKPRWISSKYVIFFLHLCLWIPLLSAPVLFEPNEGVKVQNRQAADSVGRYYHYAVTCCSWIFMFYVNANILIPYLLNRKKYLFYLLSLIPVLGILHIANRISLKIFWPEHISTPSAYILFFFFPALFFVFMSIAITLIADRIRADNREKEKVTENLRTELAFLRSQVSPHFMFNVLNSMVVLARKKSDQLEPSLFKLSSLMRYMLYETDEKKAPLEREIDYIRSYTELQSQRFGDTVRVSLVMENPDKSYLIEPMLLIPFVENAFKHGTGWGNDSEIKILLVAKDGLLEFRVSNYYQSVANETKDEVSGIGLQNVRKRLDLLYNDQYSLDIDDSGNWFNIHLQMKLD